MSPRSKCAALLLSGSTLIAFEAHAQSAQPPQATAASTVEELIVTAQRREESLVEVPLSVSVVSGAELKRANITNVESLQQVVPGLTLTFAGAHTQPTIRGVGSQVAGPGLPSNVASYLDGFYRPNAVTNNVELIDIASVQVLKGPQGTLYGRNATGGALLITTRAPSFDPSLDMKLSYASFNEARASLFATGPITDELAGSVTFFTRRSDSYYTNLVPNVSDDDRRATVGRAKLLYQPSEAVSLTLTVERVDVDDPQTFMFTNDQGRSVGVLTPGAIVASRPRDYSNDYRPIFKNESTGVFLQGVFELPWATLTSQSAAEWQRNYSGYDVDGSSVDIVHVDFPGKQDTFSQEFVLTSRADGPLQWLAGAFFYRDNGYQVLSLVTPNGLFKVLEGGVLTKSFAVYGDVTYNIMPRLYVTAGLRYSRDDLREVFSSVFDPRTTRAETDFDALTPRVSVRYELGDQESAYASYNAGYKTGGFNPSALSTAHVDPEKINAFEVGYKRASRAWDLSLAAFYYDYKDLQVTAYQGPITTLVNAAKAEIYGAEGEFSARPTQALTLSGGMSYVHARYKRFPGAPRYTYSPTSGITIAPGDASGNPVVNSPEFTARISATYVQPLPTGSLEFSGNFAYQTVVYYDAFKATKQPGYGVVNLRAAWNSDDDNLSVALFMQNATDKNYVRSIFQQPVAFSASYAPPRIIGIELRVRR